MRPAKSRALYFRKMIRIYLLNRNELENIDHSEEIFSTGRRAKLEKIKFDEDRQLSACAELLLIYALKQLDRDIALPLEISEERSGKLILESPVKGYKQIYFNLSHAKDWAACAVSDGNIGIDIEYSKDKLVARPEKILHPEEFKAYSFITNAREKQKYFYECWVTKESYLKQLGVGLIVRPSNFLVSEDRLVTEEGAKLKKRYVHVYRSTEIKNADWKFESSYKMAVCTQKKDPDTKAAVISAEDINSVLS